MSKYIKTILIILTILFIAIVQIGLITTSNEEINKDKVIKELELKLEEVTRERDELRNERNERIEAEYMSDKYGGGM